MKPRRIVLYARVSTKDRQDAQNQLDQLRDFAAKQDWTIVHEYIDNVSGKTSEKRPQFQAMLAAASRRDFDLVLFWSLDRFSREGVLETLHHLQRLAQYGVDYRSYMEQFLDSCGIFRDAVLSILATIAKQERIRVSERVHAGLAKARKQGRVGGRPRLVLSHAKVLSLSQEGCTIREIAEEMGVSPASIHRS